MGANNVNIVLQLSAIDRLSNAVDAALGKAYKSLEGFQKKTKYLSMTSFQQGRDFAQMGQTLTAALKTPVDEAVNFETAMLGVAKQVDGARDSSGKLTKVYADIREELLDLGDRIPVVQDQLAKMAEEGAKSGVVGNRDLLKFVENNAKMSFAMEMSSEETAKSMGKISNIWGLNVDQTFQYADAINYLDDKMAAVFGPDLMEIIRRTSAVGKMTGLAKEEVAALAAAYLALGRTPEVASTGMNAIFSKLSMPKGDKAFVSALAEINMTRSGLMASMQTDPMTTIRDVFGRIAALPTARHLPVAEGLFKGEYYDDAAVLIGNIHKLDDALGLVGMNIDKTARKTQHLGSINKENAARMDSMGGQLLILENKYRRTFIEFGTALFPIVKELVAILAPMLKSVSEWIQQNPELARTIGTVIAGAAALSFTISALSFAFGGIVKVGNIFATVIRFATNPVSGLSHWLFVGRYRMLQFGQALMRLGPLATAAATFLRARLLATILTLSIRIPMAFAVIRTAIVALTTTMMANPILLIITAIAVAALLIYNYWDEIVWFFTSVGKGIANAFLFIGGFLTVLTVKLWEGIKSIGVMFWDAGKNIMVSIAKGMISGMLYPIKAMADMTSKIRDFLPFSPAKAGALRDIHRIKLVETIAANIKSGPVVNAMGNVANDIANFGGGSHGGGGGGSLNYTANITINGGSESVQEDFRKQLRAHGAEISKIMSERNRTSERRAF